MNTLEATYRIVTPMFIGDADQKATSLQRTAIAPGALLRLRVLIRPGKDLILLEKYCLQLEQALLALGLLGGLSSRSRKGFGSLAIEILTSRIRRKC